MMELELKVKELEDKHDELETLYDSLHETTKKQLDENDVRTIVDQLLIEKGFMTQTDVDKKISQSQLQLIKWVIGTGLTTIAVLGSLIKFFM